MKTGQQLRRGPCAARRHRIRHHLLALMLCGTGLQTLPACAGPSPDVEVLNETSFYPEGAHLQNGALLYAEMPQHRVMRWADGENQIAWEKFGCGPTSIAPRKDGKLLVACHFAHQVIEIDLETPDAALRKDGTWLVNRPNDMTSDDKGGTYVSSSGEFSKRVPKTGAIIYIAEDGTQTRVASDIWYANGVYYSVADTTLYVSEHLGGRVLAYGVNADGSLSSPRTHIDISKHVDTEAPGIYYVGPDGLTQDDQGNLYVVIYAAGIILVFGPDADLKTRIPIPDQYVTNIDISPDQKTLYITAPTENSGGSLPGKVYRMKNPIAD